MQFIRSFVLPFFIIIGAAFLLVPFSGESNIRQKAQVAESTDVAGFDIEPTITLPPINITQTSVTLRGDTRLYLNTSAAAEKFPFRSRFDFFYPGNELKEYADGVYYRQYSYNVSGLTCGTTYSYRAVTQKAPSGALVSFTTLPCVAVGSPKITSFNANPINVRRGEQSTLSWVTENVTDCRIGGLAVRAVLPTTGNVLTEELFENKTYTLICSNAKGNEVRSSVNIIVTNSQIKPIVITLNATPNPVTRGGTSQLTLATQNATRCSSSDLGFRELGTGGTFAIENVIASRTISVTCQNDKGDFKTESITINLASQSLAPRIVSFVVNPSIVRPNEQATLSWASENTTGCAIDGLLAKPVRPSSGSVSIDPVTTTTIYTLRCSNDAGGEARSSVTLTVRPDVISNPTVSISQFQINPSSIVSGGQTTLSWNTVNALTCRLNGEIVNTNETRTLTLFNSQQYTLVCTGTDGQTVGQSRFVTVDTTNNNGGGSNQNPPIIGGFSANPLSVPQGEYVTLFWNSDADYCIAQGTWSGQKAASGSERVGPIQNNQSYTLVCYKNGRTTTQTTTAFVQQGGNTFVSQNSAAFTTVATRAQATFVDLNGTALIGNNALTQGWFEWGNTRDLGRSTEVRTVGTARTVDFGERLTNLSPSTTYFYRAVIQNNSGVYRGDIVPFTTTRIVTNVQTNFTPQPVRTTRTGVTQTAAVTPNPSQTLQAQTYGRPVFIELSLIQRTPNAVQSSVVEYDVRYRNITGTLLTNTVVKVVLPEDFTFISSNRGIYSPESRVLTLYLGEVQPREEGTFALAANVSPQAEVANTVVVTGYANYTVPATSQFREYQDEVIAYALSRIDQNNGQAVGQSAAVGQTGFWRTDAGRAVIWLLLILILLAIIYLVRRMYISFKK